MTFSASRIDPVLDAGALRALNFLGDPPPNWVLPAPGIETDVAIIGGGQNGVVLAHQLRRFGVHRVEVFDAAAEGETGIWRHPARMNALRTPKALPGPELGIPEHSFRYWYEARHGAEAYQAIGFIKRTDWADYLDWYRELVGVRIRYGERLTLIEPIDGGFRLTFRRGDEEFVHTARKVLLTTGIVGFGGACVPDFLRGLPRGLWSHTSDRIDFDRLRGRDVAVVGSAASAFDAAGVALEAGAASVHLFSRRDELVRHAPAKPRGFAAAANNFPLLPDADRWELGLINKRNGLSAPRDSMLRAFAHDNFHLHLRSRWSDLSVADGRLLVTDGGEPFGFDHVIAGTGYAADIGSQPELRVIAPYAARWADRYTPPADQRDDDLTLAPYLGAAYELLERQPGSAPWLSGIHVYSAAATLSFGRPVGDVPSMGFGIPTLVNAVVRDLYFADVTQHQRRARILPAPEFETDFYQDALWRAPAQAAAE